MFANNPLGRDVDLSHLRLVSLTFEPGDSENNSRKSNAGYLLIGLLISLVLHSLLMLWIPASEPGQPANKVINLVLTKPAPAQLIEKPVPTDSFTTESAIENPAGETPEIPVPEPVFTEPEKIVVDEKTPENPVLTQVEEQPRILTTLSAEEIREIGQREHSMDTPRRTGSISENVFHPGLRKRLREEESRPELQRADRGLKTHTDPSGATIVDLGGGKCLRSSLTRPGETQNWYMTSCSAKSESERMMERVDQTVNGKLCINC